MLPIKPDQHQTRPKTIVPSTVTCKFVRNSFDVNAAADLRSHEHDLMRAPCPPPTILLGPVPARRRKETEVRASSIDIRQNRGDPTILDFAASLDLVSPVFDRFSVINRARARDRLDDDAFIHLRLPHARGCRVQFELSRVGGWV